MGGTIELQPLPGVISNDTGVPHQAIKTFHQKSHSLRVSFHRDFSRYAAFQTFIQSKSANFGLRNRKNSQNRFTYFNDIGNRQPLVLNDTSVGLRIGSVNGLPWKIVVMAVMTVVVVITAKPFVR